MKNISNIILKLLLILFTCNQTFANKQYQSPDKINNTQAFSLNNVETEEHNDVTSYVFNGSNSFIEFTEQFGSSFSFCAWIKPADLLEKNMAIVGIPGAFWLRTTTTRELQFTQPGVRDDNTEGVLLSANNWIFVSFVINYPSAKIYLDSKLVGDYEWGREHQPWQDKIFIGKDNWREDFYGSMHNIQIFKKAIDENTIKQFFKNKPTSRSITNGIVAYHSFDGAKKFFTNGGEAETFNVNFIKDSLRGKVAEFNGKDSYIDFDEVAIDNAVTISLWVKQNEFNRNYGAMASLGHAYAFRITTGGALLFTIPQMADIWDNNARINRNTWQHVAVTFKEQHGTTFYLNGEKTNFFAVDKYQPVTKMLQVGTNLWNDFYKGQMDDLIIWDKMLTDEELKAVFNKESSFWKQHIQSKNKQSFGPLIAVSISLLFIIGYVFYLKTRTSLDTVNKPVIVNSFEQKIRETVTQNLSDSKFSVNEFAEAMNMSKTKLYNKVKASTNKSPKEYVREIRIIEAGRLLKETDMPITAVIFETGFESRAYFNKCFKEIYHLTPSEYRKNTALNT